MSSKHTILGIDIGATGIKGGLVDVKRGVMLTERYRFDTPQPATPAAMAQTVQRLIDHFNYQGPVGVGFPAVVRRGVAASAANIDDSWIGTDINKTFGAHSGMPFFTINDADAACVASMNYGSGRPYLTEGTVLMVTIGTGLGGGLYVDGRLMPNLEIGQIYLKGQKVIAEQFISNRVRRDTDMSWDEFGKKFNRFLRHVDAVFNPDLIILGGGASKSFEEYKRRLKTYAPVKPAMLRNTAGTIGAAVYAAQQAKRQVKLSA